MAKILELSRGKPEVVQVPGVPHNTFVNGGMIRPDYSDLFRVSTRGAEDRSAERWARVALEGASPAGRFIVWQVLCGLRLKKEPAPDCVAGWRIAERGDDWIRLAAKSWFMTVHAVVEASGATLSIALLVRYDNSIGALIWPPLSLVHRRAMPGLLRKAVKN